jgi:hypothetical protein
MKRLRILQFVATSFVIVTGLSACGNTNYSFTLDEDLARSSINKALEAWKDGEAPDTLQPDIIFGDTAWQNGHRLTSYEVIDSEEFTDGSNLHIHVKRKLEVDNKPVESKVIYVVGTSPKITIFPQE